MQLLPTAAQPQGLCLSSPNQPTCPPAAERRCFLPQTCRDAPPIKARVWSMKKRSNIHQEKNRTERREEEEKLTFGRKLGARRRRKPKVLGWQQSQKKTPKREVFESEN
jgi:hypothetical protein